MSKKNKIKPAQKVNQPSVKAGKKSLAVDRIYWPWLLAVLVITAIGLSPMLVNGFTNWDDELYITQNSLITGPDWNKIFTEPSASNYHPLTMLSLAFNYAISGTDPFSYHFVDWLLHILNTALVFLFIYKISGKKVFVAAFTSLIFGIHPMHVESVAWASERKDVLYAFFFLLAMIKYWNFLESGKRSNFILCFLFFVLSVLSKPSAIILPFVLFLLDYWHGRSINLKVIIEKIPFIILSLVFGFITIKVQSAEAIAGFEIYPLWTRFFFGCYTLMTYAARFFVPYPLSAFHPYPAVGDLGLTVLLSPIFIIALLILLWYKRKDKLIVFSILFFIVNLLLVIQVISIGLTIVSERYTYIPYIGLAFLFGAWLEKYISTSKTTFVKAFPIAVALIFGFISFQRTKVWKDGDTLWTDVIKKYPQEATPRSNHANYLKKMAALPEYRSQANELLLKALEDCNVAIRNKPTHSKGYENRQNINLLLNRDTAALADANALLRLEPQNSHASFTKGVVYMRLKMEDSSLFWFNNSLAANPNSDNVLNNRGSLLFNYFQRYSEALNDFNKAIQLNPTPGDYYLHRSYCFFRLGDIARAKADAIIAMQKGTPVPDSYKKDVQINN